MGYLFSCFFSNIYLRENYVPWFHRIHATSVCTSPQKAYCAKQNMELAKPQKKVLFKTIKMIILFRNLQTLDFLKVTIEYIHKTLLNTKKLL